MYLQALEIDSTYLEAELRIPFALQIRDCMKRKKSGVSGSIRKEIR